MPPIAGDPESGNSEAGAAQSSLTADTSLAPVARSGARWQTVAQVAEAGLGAGTVLFLARLVTPAEYGLVALLAAVAAFVITLTASPIGSAIVVKRLSGTEASSTALWLAVGPSVLFFAGVSLVALVLGWHGNTLAASIAISGSLPLQAAALVVIGLLQERLEFRKLATSRVTAAVVGNGAAVAIALAGSGFAGLLARAACIPLAQFLACSISARWTPSFSFGRGYVRAIVRYVRGIMGFSVMNQITRRGDDLIIGGVLGSSALGLYSLAYRFIELPISQAGQAGTNVALPVLSRISDPDRFRTAFLRAQKVLVWAVAPIGVCSMFLGDVAVTAVLGERWSDAGPIIQVFGAVAILQAATSQVGTIYLARDETGLFFKWGAYVAPAFIVCVLVGLPWGPLGVAWSYLVLNLLLFYPEWAIPGPLIGLTPGMVLKSLSGELGWAAAVTAMGALLRAFVNLNGIVEIAGAAIAASCIYWLGAPLIDRTLRRDVLGILHRQAASGPPLEVPGPAVTSRAVER